MYGHYSTVADSEPPHFLSLRSIVLKRKQPRKMFVQCNTVLKGNTALKGKTNVNESAIGPSMH